MFELFKRKVKREEKIQRKTKETEISCNFNVDGTGRIDISSGISFLDHMLELFAFHGLFDLRLNARGDLKVDLHHTNEDIGIVLGQAVKKALGNMQGVSRFGFASAPMEDVLANVTLDIGGRGHFSGISVNFGPSAVVVNENYTWNDVEHFFESFAKQSGINLIIKVEINTATLAQKSGSLDIHTVLEPVFKAFGLALRQAASIDSRRKGVPSTKGIID